MKKWDGRGLEGLPLKLLIMSLLLSLTVPAVLGSLDSFERSTARTQLQTEAIRLGDLVEEVRSAGEGNRRALSISLPATLSRFSMAMDIGGEVKNASSLSIRCLCDGKVFSTQVLDDPPARMTSPNFTSLRLEAGEHRLVAECRLIDGRLIVILEVMG
jgi:hypothetical protein